MPNANLTLVAVVLDRSGSMHPLRESTIAGLNAFLDEQRKVPGECDFLLAQFDHEYAITHRKPLKEMKQLTQADYEPRGTTALYDAVGRTIDDVGNRLAATPEADRPSKVVFVIQTDGVENASIDYNSAKIKQMITHQTDKYNWQFVFLGANQDAVLAGSVMGIAASNSLSYNANAISTSKAFGSTGQIIGSYRSHRGVGGASVMSTALDAVKNYVADDSQPVGVTGVGTGVTGTPTQLSIPGLTDSTDPNVNVVVDNGTDSK